MLRRAAAAGVLLTLLTACASLDGAAVSRRQPPTPTTGATGDPSPTDPADPADPTPAETESTDEPELRDADVARTTFRRELRELYRERYGEFSTEFAMPLDGGAALQVSRSGSYDLHKLRAEYTISIVAPDATRMDLELRATTSDAWMGIVRLPGAEQPDRTCWMHLDYELISDVAGLDLPAGMSVGVPAEVIALANGRVAGYDPGAMLVGSTDLATAAGMFGAAVQPIFGVPYESRARVPATFMIFGERLVGWRVDVADIITASDDAGYLTRKLRRRAEQTWAADPDASVTVEYDDIGERWAYRAPPPRLTVEMSADDSFETAMRRCTGLGASAA